MNNDHTHQDKRLIEDYLPIAAISAEASREKSVRKGHISTLHLWWARRPLVACRAAVFGALAPADWPSRSSARLREQIEKDFNGELDKLRNKEAGKVPDRATSAAFVKHLCKYPGSPRAIQTAQRIILEAHAERLTAELAGNRADSSHPANQPAWVKEFNWPAGKITVTVEDILAGRAPRPRVLDMFAGGGAIPLEALRLGCEAYALDLNPVAHIIELCTLVYPQKYGKPDPTSRGMTGPKNAKGETTWGGLADEVRYWGNWVLQKVKDEIGDLYPLVPDPEFRPRMDAKGRECFEEPQQTMAFAAGAQLTLGANLKSEIRNPQSRPGYLTPVAYLWTRTVKCKNPACGGIVPLVRQTWLCKKPGRCVALKMIAPRGKKQVRFEVVEARSENGLGFDPAGFSNGGNATCPFCGTVADSDHVKAEGCAGRMGQQMMAIVCTRAGKQGKVYLAADNLPGAHMAGDGSGSAGEERQRTAALQKLTPAPTGPDHAERLGVRQSSGALAGRAGFVPDDAAIRQRIQALCQHTGLTVPGEPMPMQGTLGFRVQPYGVKTWGDLFTPRQMLCLLTFTAAVRQAQHEMERKGIETERAKAVGTSLGVALDKVADLDCSLTQWKPDAELCVHAFGRQALPMVWDFAEQVPYSGIGGSWQSQVGRTIEGWNDTWHVSASALVCRGSATALPWPDASFDAVITDPPYYDNVPYADISDFFYVWLKRTVGHLYPEHFATAATPKKSEAVADATRHGGSKEKARRAYEEMMAQAFREAHRVLKPGGQMTVVYAHKTTLGWSTLVDALRQAGFTVTEAWPLDTEMKARLRGMDSAALASSIFLVARKRTGAETGNFEEAVKPELEQIVRERVETLWMMGISGADLVIACVGAGLRAFTRLARVEYANGEEVPAARFLTEVETVVLEKVLERITLEAEKQARKTGEFDAQKRQISLGHLDPASRFYILWRYTYKSAELDAGEAIIFANGTHVELDGPNGLTQGARAVLQKNKSKYRLLDFTDRGDDEELGLPDHEGNAPPTIDALHRLLWLLEHRPPEIPQFLTDSHVNREQLRLVAQALAGPGLKGGELADVSPSAEQATLAKLLANWNAVVEGKTATEDRMKGQMRLL